MPRSAPPFPTYFQLNSKNSLPSNTHLRQAAKFFSPAPILRFTVGKFSQLPPPDSPEVAILGRSNVGKSSLLNALFPGAPANFARVSSKPGHTRTLNGYTVPGRKFTIIDLPGYGYKGREEWEKEVLEVLRGRRNLKKAYMLLDSLHGPKETDINMLSELGRTGLSHQLVLTKLDRAPATLWTELGAALRQNPVRLAPHKSAARTLPTSKSKDTLAMGVWAPLRGQLALGCDETILGISSVEEWGIAELRCSILKACGLFREQNFDDDNYVNALKEVPVIEDGSEEDAEDDIEPGGPKFEDDNPMRGKVFGGKETFRKKIHRW